MLKESSWRSFFKRFNKRWGRTLADQLWRKFLRRPLLRFEPLEGRQMLSTFTWNTTPTDDQWSTSANWTVTGPADGDGIPDAGDDVVFNSGSAASTVDPAISDIK